MTLVTVDYSEKGINISADTLLTTASRHGLERDGKTKDAVPGGLKLFILSADYCLGFAGAYIVAVTLLREIFKKGIQNDLKLIKESITNTHQTSNVNDHTATDFLLCLRKEKKCLIWRDGGYLETNENCFIGNTDAYNAIDPNSTDRRSIHDLTDNPKFPTVGGLVLSVSDNNKYFYYSYKVDFYAQEVEEADSSFGFQWITVAINAPFPRLGTYFIGGEYGCLYDPLHQDEPTIVDAKSIDIFKEKADLAKACHIIVGSETITAGAQIPLSFHDPNQKPE